MSTIKVDTLQTRSGSTAAVTGAGFVATDQIRGNTSAGSTTVVAEGGTNTTNLQQGLTKHWVRCSGSSFTVADSFNTASVTDAGTGLSAPALTTSMGNTNYAITTGCDDKQDGADIFVYNVRDDVAQATGGYGMSGKKEAYAAADLNQNAVSTILGDLA